MPDSRFPPPVMQPLEGWVERPPEAMRERARAFLDELRRRRTVREFSDRPVAREVIEDCLRAAGTAPSGANLQPWLFVVVTDPEVKRTIRVEAEAEEREFYERRAPDEWLEALAPLGTDAEKPFLETAPVLIAIFARRHSETASGRRVKNYYVPESVGIATGFLIAALHHAGLATLTHTPSPMGFLNRILSVEPDARPAILLVVGHPAPGCRVPAIGRKPLDAIARWV
ncbi:MAG TPA: nitroreductase family protein [Burkholderiaceae bacterium]|nr:nitroreductase family protein [Burkholderiaceae bacterium]